MPQVEDVARRAAERIEHAARFLAHARGWRHEHRGIEIALQRDLRADAAAGFARISAPVQPDRLAAAGRDALKPAAAAFGEDDARNFAP
jgi:hypothetical protein